MLKMNKPHATKKGNALLNLTKNAEGLRGSPDLSYTRQSVIQSANDSIRVII